jgi:hypothetical protein
MTYLGQKVGRPATKTARPGRISVLASVTVAINDFRYRAVASFREQVLIVDADPLVITRWPPQPILVPIDDHVLSAEVFSWQTFALDPPMAVPIAVFAPIAVILVAGLAVLFVILVLLRRSAIVVIVALSDGYRAEQS